MCLADRSSITLHWETHGMGNLDLPMAWSNSWLVSSSRIKIQRWLSSTPRSCQSTQPKPVWNVLSCKGWFVWTWLQLSSIHHGWFITTPGSHAFKMHWNPPFRSLAHIFRSMNLVMSTQLDKLMGGIWGTSPSYNKCTLFYSLDPTNPQRTCFERDFAHRIRLE